MVNGVLGILATQYEGRDREADEIENSQETENAVDEDGDTTVVLRVVAEFGDASPWGFLDCWLGFLLIYPEYPFDDFARREEVNEQEKRGRGREECWDYKGVRLESG